MTIAQLRAEPADALSRFIYAFDNPGLVEGSTGTVDQSGTSVLTSTLAFRAGGTPGIDYFFPYARVPKGVIVENPADGAIAITPPMNGCALQVNSNGGNLIFYHDPNGKRMAQADPAEAGTKVCHITAAAYWDDAWASSIATTGGYPGYQFVCVHRGGTWHVGVFRLGTDQNGAVKTGGPGLGPRLKSSYIGSFGASEELILNS